MDSIIKSFTNKDVLCPVIWVNNTSNDFDAIKMDPLIRGKILMIAKQFMESFGVEDIEIEDVLVVGSIANYNWSEFSDIDIHLLMDKTKLCGDEEFTDEFFQAKKGIFNDKHDITLKGFDVEVYVQGIDEELDSKGVYSVLYSKWLSVPERTSVSPDKAAIIKKVKEFNSLLKNIENTTDLRARVNKIEILKEKIKKYRKAGLNKNGENGVENLVFKYLRRSEYMEKLTQLKLKSLDKLLSLENNVK